MRTIHPQKINEIIKMHYNDQWKFSAMSSTFPLPIIIIYTRVWEITKSESSVGAIVVMERYCNFKITIGLISYILESAMPEYF